MEKKVNIEKIKQITLIACGVLLLAVGFINYNPSSTEVEGVAVTDARNTTNLGDVQLVSSNALVENENTTVSALVDNLENTNSAPVENSASATATGEEDYFTKTKLERDTMYSQMLESYQKILENKDLPETQKSIAVQEIDKINKAQNSIMIAENLIMNKGFDNVVVLVNNNAINVVIKTAHLSNEDIGKIQNVIEREFSVELSQVNISNRI